MKKSPLLFTLLLASISAQAQQRSYGNDANRREYRDAPSCPKVYFTIASGINNPTGLLGLGFDVAVAQQVSVGGGLGLSTWGTKVAVEGRYYFEDCHRGWAIGGGITSNSGVRNFTTQLETVQYGSNTTVVLDLHRKTNLFFSGYRFFNLSKGGSRFHLQLGYSKGFAPARYTERSGLTLTSTSDAVVRAISPGGVVLGLGFSFGIGR